MTASAKLFTRNGSARRITLTVPVIVLVLAATALPIAIRPLGAAKVDFGFDDLPDFAANVLGFLPVGIVLGNLGLLRATLIGGAISLFAETSQLFMMFRDPTVSDLVANVVGTFLGALVSARWRIHSPTLRIGRRVSATAALLAGAIIYYSWVIPGSPENKRGAKLPGTLESRWSLDESSGKNALDSSGHEIAGKFYKEPNRRLDTTCRAPVFDGSNFMDAGRPTDLRLVGSMTISAWINSSAYPADDAAVVSSLHDGRGYQLDTTIDRGPRTIGFKLTNASGELMARYGATPLSLNTWHHIAGVYDASAQTLDVYLDGKLDNGFLLGPVSGSQLSSRGSVYVGKRGDVRKFNFSGLIRDACIYSFPLTEAQIAGNMRGETGFLPLFHSPIVERPEPPLPFEEDKTIPAFAAALGTLVAIACLGFHSRSGWKVLLGASFGAGLILSRITAADLPPFNAWMTPLVSLAGGAAVAMSVCRPTGVTC